MISNNVGNGLIIFLKLIRFIEEKAKKVWKCLDMIQQYRSLQSKSRSGEIYRSTSLRKGALFLQRIDVVIDLEGRIALVLEHLLLGKR